MPPDAAGESLPTAALCTTRLRADGDMTASLRDVGLGRLPLSQAGGLHPDWVSRTPQVSLLATLNSKYNGIL